MSDIIDMLVVMFTAQAQSATRTSMMSPPRLQHLRRPVTRCCSTCRALDTLPEAAARLPARCHKMLLAQRRRLQIFHATH